MIIYTVMLECSDDTGNFFGSYDIAAPSKDDASLSAVAEMEREGATVISVDEVVTNGSVADDAAVSGQILARYGRSYFG